jgi:hypothetical protein
VICELQLFVLKFVKLCIFVFVKHVQSRALIAGNFPGNNIYLRPIEQRLDEYSEKCQREKEQFSAWIHVFIFMIFTRCSSWL